MPYCARLTYASTTTSTPAALRQDLTDILAEARIHNFNNQLHGVLYYGNNYFFQCLEGQKTLIDILYQKLLKDPRHKNVVLLSYHEINRVTLTGWDLKFVLNAPEVQQFFNQYQWEKFNPYSLKDGAIDEFLALLIPQDNMEPSDDQKEIKSHFESPNRLITSVFFWLLMFIGMLLTLFYLYYMFGAKGFIDFGFFKMPE